MTRRRTRPCAPRFDRILFLTDLSSRVDVGLAYAQGLARGPRARVHLLHVLAASPGPGARTLGGEGPAGSLQPWLEAAEGRLAVARQSFRGLWSPVTIEVRRGDPGREVLACAEEIGAHVVVVAGPCPGLVGPLLAGPGGRAARWPVPVLVVPWSPAEDGPGEASFTAPARPARPAGGPWPGTLR